MKTLAQLKRDAASGNLVLTLMERYGNNEIPERMKGARKVVGVNTVAIKLLNNDGNESELRIDAASLVDYDDNSLTIYSPGFRELNEQEKAILKQAKEKADEYNAKYPYNDTYWIRRSFIEKSSCPYLMGSGFKKGKRYDCCREIVQDKAIKGDAILRYVVSMA